MISVRLPPCCTAAAATVRCESFALSLPIDTRARRHAAVENGFIAESKSHWHAAFTARTLVDAGNASKALVSVRLVLAVAWSAALPLTLTAALAMATPLVAGVTYGPFLAVLTLLFANMCHELGHLLAYGLLSARQPHVHVVARLGFAYVVRRPLPPLREAAVVVSGPLLVAFCCAIAMIFVTHVIEVIVLASIGAGHLGTLLVPVGDGANLREAFRTARSAKFNNR